MKNIKGKMLIALTLLVVCTLSVIILHHLVKQKIGINNFVRRFPPHPILPYKEFDLKYNSYYIAGGTRTNIYLANTSTPFHLLKINTVMTDTQHISLKIHGLDKSKLLAITTRIDSPYVHLTHGIMPAIFRSTLDNFDAKRYTYDSVYFSECIPIGSESFILRSIDNRRENVLVKETSTPPHLIIKDNILLKQIDGVFCTDGMLRYDSYSNKLVYTYYYRNQFISLDTSLNIVFKANTIDTTSMAKIKVAELKSENTITLSAPPLVVNKQSEVYKNLLFVNSNIISDNERREVFTRFSVIDVYDLNAEGAYKFSFYIFDFSKKKMKSFKIYNNILLAIHDHYLVAYKLNPDVFRQN